MALHVARKSCQLSLAFGHDESTLRAYLQETAGLPLSLLLTNNRTSMVSVRSSRGAVVVRAHRMFLHASLEVLEELAFMVRDRRGPKDLIKDFVRENQHRIDQGCRRPIVLRHEGRHYDLRVLFDDLNKEYFEGMLPTAITWGRRPSRRFARKQTLGSYNLRDELIRVTPVLDSRSVPRYFVEFVIYHEMLHAYLQSRGQKRGASLHTPEFRALERKFRYYEKAAAWERNRWG